MSNERRFTESEIASILESASAAQDLAQDLAEPTSMPALVPAGRGLTLAQLQEIGVEVGLSPVHIAEAANAVSRGALVPTNQHRWLGLPIGVSRTIEFGRTIDDAEWERIVVALRETFQARGRLQQDGSFRQWTNGNLQALLEPTASGHRLRLSTRKGDAKTSMLIGVGLLGGAFATSATLALGGAAVPVADYIAPVLLSGMGVISLLFASVRLPRWARTRAAQMEDVALRAARIAP